MYTVASVCLRYLPECVQANVGATALWTAVCVPACVCTRHEENQSKTSAIFIQSSTTVRQIYTLADGLQSTKLLTLENHIPSSIQVPNLSLQLLKYSN